MGIKLGGPPQEPLRTGPTDGLGLDASDVEKMLLQVGASPFVSRRAVSRLTGGDPTSGTAPALVKLGMFRGQEMQRLPSTTFPQFNRPDTGGGTTYIGDMREKLGWGKLATGITTMSSVTSQSLAKHQNLMTRKLISLRIQHGFDKGNSLYQSMYGPLPYGDKWKGGHGFVSDMSKASGQYAPSEDIIRLSDNAKDPNNQAATLEHEGMHRGVNIMRNMYAANQSAFPRDGQTVLHDIPMERHNLSTANLPGGTTYLEDRFLKEPWSRTIGGTTYTIPDIMEMYKNKNLEGKQRGGFHGGEHAVIAKLMQNYPDLESGQWHRSYYINPFLKAKQKGGRLASYNRTGREWGEAIDSTASAIEKYLAQSHGWTPGGGQSTVLDRHIKGQYAPWTID